jgi:hypothetical protein
MMQKVFRTSALLSALFDVGLIMLWASSYWRTDAYIYYAYSADDPTARISSSTGYALSLFSSYGGVMARFNWAHAPPSSNPPLPPVHGRASEPNPHYPVPRSPPPGRGWQFGASGFAVIRHNQSGDLPGGMVEIVLPMPLVIVLISVLPTCWFFWDRKRRRRESRRAKSQCLACGYDLRASKDRCPECGEPISSAA